MAKSLQEQLLKAGVASKQQANKAKADKRKAQKQKKKAEEAPTNSESLEAKRERDRALNQKLNEEKAQKALLSEALDLLTKNNQPLNPDAEIRYNYVFNKKVKSIFVNQEQQNKLAKGQWAIVTPKEDQLFVVERPIAEKVAARCPEWVHMVEKEVIDEDDPYAAYQVPDDLMW
jgi:uncharacterized protein YaiL (DUF2058 family)